MNYLTQGGLSLKTLDLLFELRSFRSDSMKGAIKDYLVPNEINKAGRSIDVSASLNGVDRNNLIKAIAKLNETATTVEKLKEDAWPEYNAFTRSIIEVTKVTTLIEVSKQ